MEKVRNNIDPVVILDDEEEDLFIFEKAFNKSDLENPLIKFTQKSDLSTHLSEVKNGKQPMPALLVIDINLGFDNGFEVVSSIRSDSYFNPVPTIMMLTSSNFTMDKEKTKEVGADGFAIKPHGLTDYVAFLNTLK
jgi:DNA-binding response OmpR family regulator